jgi:hypothetical protein
MGLFDGLLGDSLGDVSFGDALGAGALALGAYSMFNGGGQDKNMKRALDRQAELSGALADPNSPMFQSIEASERAKAHADFTKLINQLAVKSRRQSARTGGMGMIDPERRDEFVSSALSRGESRINDVAKQRAREFLQTALGANTGLTQAYGAAGNAAQTRTNRMLGGAEIGLKGADKLFGKRTFGDVFGRKTLNGDPNFSFGAISWPTGLAENFNSDPNANAFVSMYDTRNV